MNNLRRGSRSAIRIRRLRVRRPALALLGALVPMIAHVPAAAAEAGLGAIYVENWGFFQRNTNGSNQWKDEPRLYVPWRLDEGWTFTQRIDVPLIYTDASGPGNPGGGYSGGVGDAFIEEIFDSPEAAPNFRWRASVRFVFPTGKQKPFGSSQYQWAPGGGFTWAFPEVWGGVTLTPFVRYFSGFAPQHDNVQEVRKLDLYPAASFELGHGWSVSLYPENAITYNDANRSWFVPLDLMLVQRVGRDLEYGIGGAYELGHPSDPAFRYVIDARLTYRF